MPLHRPTPGILVALSCLVLSFLSANAVAKTLYVEKWGDNANPCTKTAPCKEIQHTVMRAGRNDRIVVGPGIYLTNIDIFQNAGGQSLEGLKLESTAGRFGTTLVALATSQPVITTRQPRVRIGRKGKGFTVANSIGGGAGFPGIGIEVSARGNGDRTIIEGNRALGNEYGMMLAGERLQVRHNIIQDNTKAGVFCLDCTRGLIRSNRVVDNDEAGILLGMTGQAVIERNEVSGNALSGILQLAGDGHMTIRNNVVVSSGTPSLAASGISINEADGAKVQGNIATGNWSNGIGMSQTLSTTPPHVIGNLSSNNAQAGIRLIGIQGGKVDHNTLVDNTHAGLLMDTGVSGTTFRNNNAVGNDISGSNCGAQNTTAALMTLVKQFFGPVDTACGSHNLVSPATKAGPLKINIARGVVGG